MIFELFPGFANEFKFEIGPTKFKFPEYCTY